MLNFWLSVCVKTFWDSVEFIGETRTGLLFGALVIAVTLIRLYRRHGLKDAMNHWASTSGEGVVIAVAAFVIVMVAHFMFEPYHLLDDMRARRDDWQSIAGSFSSKVTACSADLRVATSESGLLGSQVMSQQGVINSQQGIINSQHEQANKQQETMNQCVAVLAKTVDVEPAKIMLSDVSLDTGQKGKDGRKLYAWILIALVSKPVSPLSGVLKCNEPYSVYGGAIAFPYGVDSQSLLVGPYKTEEGGYRINYTNPAIWKPNVPLVFMSVSTSPPKGCVFTAD